MFLSFFFGEIYLQVFFFYDICVFLSYLAVDFDLDYDFLLMGDFPLSFDIPCSFSLLFINPLQSFNFHIIRTHIHLIILQQG